MTEFSLLLVTFWLPPSAAGHQPAVQQPDADAFRLIC
jgi:hypothetical protein